MHSVTPHHASSIETVIATVLDSGYLSPTQMHQLRTALQKSDRLSHEHQAMIQRILYGVRHGLLTQTD